MKKTQKSKKPSEHIETWKAIASGAVVLFGVAAGLAKMLEKK